MGQLPQTAILRSETVVSLSQNDQHVKSTVVTFGRVYASRLHPYTTRTGEQQNVFTQSLAGIKAACRDRMNQVSRPWSKSLMVAGLLLASLDVLIMSIHMNVL